LASCSVTKPYSAGIHPGIRACRQHSRHLEDPRHQSGDRCTPRRLICTADNPPS
jgi:hypothetical protein